MKHGILRKHLSSLLALIMIVGMLPMSVIHAGALEAIPVEEGTEEATEEAYCINITNKPGTTFVLEHDFTSDICDLWNEIDSDGTGELKFDQSFSININDAIDAYNNYLDTEYPNGERDHYKASVDIHNGSTFYVEARIWINNDNDFRFINKAGYMLAPYGLDGEKNDGCGEWYLSSYYNDLSEEFFTMSIDSTQQILNFSLDGTVKEIYEALKTKNEALGDVTIDSLMFDVWVSCEVEYYNSWGDISYTELHFESLDHTLYDKHIYESAAEYDILPAIPTTAPITANVVPAFEECYVPVKTEYNWYYEFIKEGYDEEDGQWYGYFERDETKESDVLTETGPSGTVFGVAYGTVDSGDKNYMTLNDILNENNKDFINSFIGEKPREFGGKGQMSIVCTVTLTFEDGKQFELEIQKADYSSRLIAPCMHACTVCGLCTVTDKALPCNFDQMSREISNVCICDEPSVPEFEVTVESENQLTIESTDRTVNVVVEKIKVEETPTHSFIINTTDAVGADNVIALYNINVFDEEGYPYTLNQWGDMGEELTVRVSVSTEEALALQSGEAVLYHILADGTAEVIENVTVEIDGESATMIFTSDSFSPYIVARKADDSPDDPIGVIVSGTVSSFNSDTDEITIELYAEGSASADYTVTVKGNTAEYSIECVSAGTYTMKVSKANHVAREYTVVVGTDDVTQNAKICLKGDINGDGIVNTSDNTLMMRHIKQTKLLTDYSFLVADINGDSVVDTSDNTLMMRDILAPSVCEHNYVWVEGAEPTCKEEGVVAHYHCEYCGKNFDPNYGEIETISIPKAEHEYGSMYWGKSANFWENGNIEYYQCAVCEKYFDEEFNEVETVVIPKYSTNLSICVNGTPTALVLGEQHENFIEWSLEGLSVTKGDVITICQTDNAEIRHNYFADGNVDKDGKILTTATAANVSLHATPNGLMLFIDGYKYEGIVIEINGVQYPMNYVTYSGEKTTGYIYGLVNFSSGDKFVVVDNVSGIVYDYDDLSADFSWNTWDYHRGDNGEFVIDNAGRYGVEFDGDVTKEIYINKHFAPLDGGYYEVIVEGAQSGVTMQQTAIPEGSEAYEGVVWYYKHDSVMNVDDILSYIAEKGLYTYTASMTLPAGSKLNIKMGVDTIITADHLTEVYADEVCLTKDGDYVKILSDGVYFITYLPAYNAFAIHKSEEELPDAYLYCDVGFVALTKDANNVVTYEGLVAEANDYLTFFDGTKTKYLPITLDSNSDSSIAHVMTSEGLDMLFFNKAGTYNLAYNAETGVLSITSVGGDTNQGGDNEQGGNESIDDYTIFISVVDYTNGNQTLYPTKNPDNPNEVYVRVETIAANSYRSASSRITICNNSTHG